MTLPRGWVRTELGSCLASVRTGPFGSSVHKSDYVFGGAPLINPMHIVGGSIRPSAGITVAAGKARELAEFQLAEGDVILGRRGEMGRCAVAGEEAAGWLIGTGSMALSADEALDPAFLQKWLSSEAIIRALENAAVGSTMVNLNQSILLSLNIALPPAAEQRRIVAKLDALTARLARARAELDRVPLLSARLRETAVTSAFSGWPRERLGDLSSSIRYGYTASARPNGPGAKFLRITDLQKGAIDWERVPFVSPAAADIDRCGLKTGDIVFARSGATVGKSQLIVEPPKDAVFASYLIRVRVDPVKLTPEVAAYYFQSSEYWQQVHAGASGTGQPNFNGSKLANLLVPVNGEVHQLRAVARVMFAFARADRLEAEAARARALLDRLESAILAKAFRGELVPQDPEDEPARVLLERIRAARAAAPRAKRGRRVRETADA